MKRFPVGLTTVAMIALAALVALGVWQLKRLAWKKDLLSRIAALQDAPASPLTGVLAEAAAGRDVGYVRVRVDCASSTRLAPAIYRYALRDGQVGWRLLSYCLVAARPWDGIVLDRGLVDRFAGRMSPNTQVFPGAGAVTGVLRAPGAHSLLDVPPSHVGGALLLLSVDPSTLALIAGPGRRPASYYLAVESETPAPPGVTPAALPQDIPNNHFVYALTWFGLAAVLVWTWLGYVWRRMRER